MKAIRFLACLYAACLTLACIARSSALPCISERLEIYTPDPGSNTGFCVVMLPGGAYHSLATGREGRDWAPFFNQSGITTVLLKYTMPEGRYELPGKDVTETFGWLRQNADSLGIDPDKIGVMGSSAGGHLAATACTLLAGEIRPDFQILLYPVISMTDSIGHAYTRKWFMGEYPLEQTICMYSLEDKANSLTPPTLIIQSIDDEEVNPDNSRIFAANLQSRGIPVQLTEFPSGGHGWGIRENFEHHDRLLETVSTWMIAHINERDK